MLGSSSACDGSEAGSSFGRSGVLARSTAGSPPVVDVAADAFPGWLGSLRVILGVFPFAEVPMQTKS